MDSIGTIQVGSRWLFSSLSCFKGWSIGERNGDKAYVFCSEVFRLFGLGENVGDEFFLCFA